MAKLKGKWIDNDTIPETKLTIKNDPTNSYILSWNNSDAKMEWVIPVTPDSHDTKVSANDTTPGFLNGKLLADTGKTTLTENNDGGNETLTIGIGADVFDVVADSTSDITEGTKLFYTDARVDTRITNIWSGAVAGFAPLDADSKIPSSYLPAIAITETDVVADITARDALTPQEGDVAIVTDASADPNVGSGAASYICDGAAWQQLKAPDDVVQSVNGATGTVVLTTTEVGEGTNLYYTDARVNSHLSGGTGITYTAGAISIDLTDTLNFTGTLQYNGEEVLTSSSGVIETKKVEIITITATNITNTYVDLVNVPITATAVQVIPVGGVQQEYTVDFVVITDGADIKRLSWAALGMATILVADDKLIVSYTY